jgi:hypothetical protein
MDKVLLISADASSKRNTTPNLALMKISSYYKQQGDEVGFHVSNPDHVYVSCVFSKNLPTARGVQTYYPDAEFHIGGPGLMKPNALPHEMEYVMPDYDLYGIDYSMGFTTRGCVRNCGFCIVHLLEPEFVEYKHPSVFHHPDHEKILFMDNNFTASKRFDEVLDYIEEHGLKPSFNQGLDARLITKEKAKRIAEVELWNGGFTRRTTYVSWDFIENEKPILRGIRNLIEAGVLPTYIRTYVLVGYNTTHEQDIYRVQKLIDMKTMPFVMKYNNRRDDVYLNHLARWANRSLYRQTDFEGYLKQNSYSG